MKGLFKQKPKTPAELVQHVRELLLFVQNNAASSERKREEKVSELSKLLLEMRTVLFGNGQVEPNSDACSQLTQEFFRENTFQILIDCLPKLELGARKNATHVIANFQRQRVNGRLIASEYMEKNLELMDVLLRGYEDEDNALTYGAISRECLRHQTVARYILESEHTKKLFGYIQLPNYEIASDAQATFKELMTRHKSTVAEYISANYDWFFHEFNSQLLESSNYITRRYAVKLLGDMLLDRSNTAVMIRYVSSLDNMRILMNLFRDAKKSIQLEAFHVFKLFVANQNKPPEIVSVLVKNRSKLVQFLGDLTTEKGDEPFQADKHLVIKEISTLETGDRSDADLGDSQVEP